MNDLQYIAVGLTLVESDGRYFKAGAPRTLCRFQACHLPGGAMDDGRVCVVARDRATGEWREYDRPTTAEQARQVLANLRMLGIPGRVPVVEMVPDTSDGWSHLLVRVCVGEESQTLEIGAESSGFDGADAEGLRELFRGGCSRWPGSAGTAQSSTGNGGLGNVPEPPHGPGCLSAPARAGPRAGKLSG